MKKLILYVLFLLISGCNLTQSALPDEFWAYGTWRYDGDESKLTVAAEGVATIAMHFTREQDDQYLIAGTVDYDQGTLSCNTFTGGELPLCKSNTCELSETIPGELSGVAVVRDGKLLITQHWVTKPDERYTWFCTKGASTTQSNWSVWQTIGNLGAGVVDGNWEVDITEAAFLDDIPTNEITDAKIISSSFDVAVNQVTAKGLIGFYRKLP